MLRSELIQAVKARIDELTPFEEPDGLVALPTSDVKPLSAIIDQTLPRSADAALTLAPTSIIRDTVNDLSLQANGTPAFGSSPVLSRMMGDEEVGVLPIPADYLRLHTVAFDTWRRDVHRAISSDTADYCIMRNPHTRPRNERPAVAVNNGVFEIYSLTFPSDDGVPHCRSFLYIPHTTDACPHFEDSVAPLIILETAKDIFESLNNLNAAKILIEEEQRWLQTHTLIN